jgi:hypothetical protein
MIDSIDSIRFDSFTIPMMTSSGLNQSALRVDVILLVALVATVFLTWLLVNHI